MGLREHVRIRQLTGNPLFLLECLASLSQLPYRYWTTWKKWFSEMFVEVVVSEPEYPVEGHFLTIRTITNEDSNKRNHYCLFLKDILSLRKSTLWKNFLAQSSFRFHHSPQVLLRPEIIWEPKENQCLWGVSLLFCLVLHLIPVISL